MARQGVWTPWAAVLCVACEQIELRGLTHYERRIAYLASVDVNALIDRPDGTLLAVCDECRCECWVTAEIALLQRIKFSASALAWDHGTFGVELAQTGGMCAALVLVGSDTGQQIVVTGLDGTLVIGRYADEDWNDPLDMVETVPYCEGGALVADATLAWLVSEAARIAVQFCSVDGGAA